MSKENLEEKVLEKLKEKFPIEEDLTFNEYTIQSKIEKHSYLLMKYHHQFINAKAKVNKLEEEYEKLVGEKYDYYRFNFEENLTKTEIEKYYLVKDKDILKLKQAIRIQTIVIDFFEMCVKELESMNWSIKSYIEILRRGL